MRAVIRVIVGLVLFSGAVALLFVGVCALCCTGITITKLLSLISMFIAGVFAGACLFAPRS